MKKIAIYSVALVFAACSNQTANTEDNHEGHNQDSGMEETIDTVAIKPGQKVFFKNLQDGQEITLPFVVEFGVEGMEVEPASVPNTDKGHHHLFVDQGPVPANKMVPMGQESSGYFHFGKGQLLDTLTLSKYPMLTSGSHKLRLQFANGLHLSYGPAMSTEVNVIIK
ncbi:MAG: DUF4399 domain-containing protein [Bacteroidia bacterium]|nr:DUF4399 domain-containing protein [Bacteroidia bacterium]